MADVLTGRAKGVEQVAAALRKAPEIFFSESRRWLKNERANMLGGKDAKGKKRRGYREILANKPRKGRLGKWAKQFTGLFRGRIPYTSKLGDMTLRMGLLSKSNNQLQKAMRMMYTGGTITSDKFMPIPIYKNLRSAGWTGAFTSGKASNLKNAAFKAYSTSGRLTAMNNGREVLWFDRRSRKRSGKFDKSGLLFYGTKSISVKRQLKGRYDFYKRWDRLQIAAISRGQTAMNKATRRVERFR